MSDQGLQQVIDELKSRGLRAGEEEGDKIIASAKAEADQILSNAREEADRLVGTAKSEADAMRTQLDAELRQASAVGLEAFRQKVESSFLVPAVNEELRKQLTDPAGLQAIIVATATGFASTAGGNDTIEVLLPEAQREALGNAFMAELKKQVGAGVTVRFESGFKFGFRIAPEGSGYVFDFSEDGFKEIFLQFLAPRFREYFFEK